MKNLFNLFLVSILAFGLSACNNEELDSNQEKAEESFTILTKYKDVLYTVPCMLVNDSLIYLNAEFNELYQNEISSIPELSILTYKVDGMDVVEYYQNSQELETRNGITYFNEEGLEDGDAGARATIAPTAGRAILYDDTNFKDRTVVLDINYDVYITIPNLKKYAAFNDKTSAIRVFNFLQPDKYYKPSYALNSSQERGSNLRTVLIGYKHDTFRGSTLYCVAEYSSSANLNNPASASHQDWKLKNLGWNDKISSVVFRIITTDLIGKDIHPHN